VQHPQAGRADALRWFFFLFFLSGHVSPPSTELAFNVVKFTGGQPDEAAIARGVILVECSYGPVLNLIEKRIWLSPVPHCKGRLDETPHHRAIVSLHGHAGWA
jgi:hypothetical protein